MCICMYEGLCVDMPKSVVCDLTELKVQKQVLRADKSLPTK